MHRPRAGRATSPRAPDIDAFVASGYDDNEDIDMAELRERRR
ncbi:hypothetical protein [Streptomyces caniferus]